MKQRLLNEDSGDWMFPLVFVILALCMLVLTIGLTIGAATSSGAVTASCTTSFPTDGHAGPWRTTNNGGTLHGNTIHISCPNSGTHWHIVYRVQANTGGPWINALNDDRSGNGSPPDFSVSLSPYQCDTQGLYRTHVDNGVTGGAANKPAGGGGVHLACG